MAEEAFSFRVRAARPSAARILDMQDLHSLRYARHDAVKTALATAKARPDPVAEDKTPSPVLAALAAVPEAGDDHLSRELASVHRCDLALVCSPVETTLLRDRYRVPSEKLIPASFFCDPPPREFPTPGFEPRAGFVTIGTFYHPPNVDSVRWMSEEVWPLIRLALPKATMRVYGAYPTEAIKQLHRPKQGFFVEGFAPTVQGAMEDARVLLAPLRFGAGIKGKIVDAWQNGLPVVTTPVGAEGMVPGAEKLWRPNDIDDGEVWGGRWRSTDAAGIAADAVALHEDRDAWERARARGGELVGELFPAEANLAEVRAAVEGLFEEVVAEQEEIVAEQEVGAGGREGRVAALIGGAGGITWARRCGITPRDRRNIFRGGSKSRRRARIPARIRQRASTSRGSIRSSPSSSPSPSSSLTRRARVVVDVVLSSDGPRHSDITFLTSSSSSLLGLSIRRVRRPFPIRPSPSPPRLRGGSGNGRGSRASARRAERSSHAALRVARRPPRGSPPRRLCSGANAPRSP